VTSTLPLLDRDELAATADRAGVPERAVAAYASAALQLREERPGCGLTWVTLAGIGWVESQHGARYLCASGGDLTQGDAWVRAIRSYNHSDDHVRSVLAVADTYVDRANG
jgi:hypothetical protein